MEHFLIGLNIFILIGFIGILVFMHKKRVSFSKRVFTGLGFGIVYGLLLNLIYGADHEVIAASTPWFRLVGTGYIKFLQMIVMPLVFISILTAFTKITFGHRSEEHTSELQSRFDLVCRLLLEKKNKIK